MDSAHSSRPARAMAAAAQALLDATPPAHHALLVRPFTLEARSDWSYVPRKRAGIALREMDAKQRDATHALLEAALSERGLVVVHAIMSLEIALRELEAGQGPHRDPENYAIVIFAHPHETQPWGWRIEGHHVSLHFTLSAGGVAASLPQFVGANPATVPRDFDGGPMRGERALGDLEDLAFALMESLAPAQWQRACFSDQPFSDIVTGVQGEVRPLDPVGIAFGELDGSQQAKLLRIVESLASLAREPIARSRLERVHEGGLGSIRFGWAGSRERRERHYWRIQGARFVIEWDNTGGNHIHCAWRDFEGDWGRDVLAEHHRDAKGTAHRH